MSGIHLLGWLCARLQTHFVESKWGVGHQVLLTKQFYSPVLRNDERVGSHQVSFSCYVQREAAGKRE